MKKTICITPADDTMEAWVVAVKILNEFKLMDFTKREDFVGVVQKYDETYRSDYKKVNQLYNFWQMRNNSQKTLKDLQEVLNKITSQNTNQ